MRLSVFFILLATALLSAITFASTIPASFSGHTCAICNHSLDVSDTYIVTLRSTANFTHHLKHANALTAENRRRSRQGQAFDGVTHQWNFPGFQAYAANLPSSVIAKLKHHEDVAGVVQDSIWTASSLEVQPNAPYNLHQISNRATRGEFFQYYYDSSVGQGTYAYILDTGINARHLQFQSRVRKGFNAVKACPFDDLTGHGTHTAGVLGARTYGVAKRCQLIDVKVSSGHETNVRSILDGYNWAVKDIQANKRQHRSVINLSFDPRRDRKAARPIEDAIAAAWSNDILTVVSAGNRNGGTAWRGMAIIVGATDEAKVRARFSNYGDSLGLFAPGVNIKSTWIGPRATETASISGTSAAAAHVAGVILTLMASRRSRSAVDIEELLYDIAIPYMVKDTHGSKNLFLYNGSGR
ncbi:subtilisin-like protein [Myriangium duriaei CBS 260.36]|uniref:Subtilisin-like protein n=1 Tax=Myriangium duriaei CBS 260.36 TaxID=1168546 RepID=A0A9P4IU65_9PEZI|nr:subtilisin-like protein [Myriangium duriaei CBS 260.36]